MYSKIFEFCKVKNFGNFYKNNQYVPTPRIKFIMNLLKSEGIEYEIDKFLTNDNLTGYNVVMKGTSSRMVVAHHDIVNRYLDNANDNSCSCINAIMIKKLMPEINVVLTDGEEFGGRGAQRVCDLIKSGHFGNIEWVLNLELTGKGGKYFFIGDYPGKLTNHIKSLFDCPIVYTPFNDSHIFNKNGIDSVVINPLPPLKEKLTAINGKKGGHTIKWDDNTYLEFSLLFNCHTQKDTLDTIDINDMKEFVETVLIKILS